MHPPLAFQQLQGPHWQSKAQRMKWKVQNHKQTAGQDFTDHWIRAAMTNWDHLSHISLLQAEAGWGSLPPTNGCSLPLERAPHMCDQYWEVEIWFLKLVLSSLRAHLNPCSPGTPIRNGLSETGLDAPLPSAISSGIPSLISPSSWLPSIHNPDGVCVLCLPPSSPAPITMFYTVSLGPLQTAPPAESFDPTWGLHMHIVKDIYSSSR